MDNEREQIRGLENKSEVHRPRLMNGRLPRLRALESDAGIILGCIGLNPIDARVRANNLNDSTCNMRKYKSVK